MMEVILRLPKMRILKWILRKIHWLWKIFRRLHSLRCFSRRKLAVFFMLHSQWPYRDWSGYCYTGEDTCQFPFLCGSFACAILFWVSYTCYLQIIDFNSLLWSLSTWRHGISLSTLYRRSMIWPGLSLLVTFLTCDPAYTFSLSGQP